MLSLTNTETVTQVTESIPKRLFDQANQNMKTIYQRSVQVPKIGTKQVFLAINPTPGGARPFPTPGTNNPNRGPVVANNRPQQPSTSGPRPADDQVNSFAAS